MKPTTASEAEAARDILATLLRDLPQLRGIGIAVLDEGYGVKVNLSEPVQTPLPDDVDGVPVIVDVVGTIELL